MAYGMLLLAKLADFLHTYAFSLALSTFQQAIQNKNSVTWPAIDTTNLKKNWRQNCNISRTYGSSLS